MRASWEACWRLQVLDFTCCFTGTKVQIPTQVLIALAGLYQYKRIDTDAPLACACFTGGTKKNKN
jgi:hypothetical protein